MPYAAPTAVDLKARFPAFADVADSVIDQALADAALMVDDLWVCQADFTLGRLLYAAHILTLDGHGTGAEAELAAAGALSFTTFRSDQLQLQRDRTVGQSIDDVPSDLGITIYGKRFLDLLRRNRIGPVAIT